MTKLFLAIVLPAAFAQTALAPPQMGFVQDAGNSLRPVHGIAGNFMLGDTVVSRADASAFSGTYGLVKTAGAIIVTDDAGRIVGGRGAGPGKALFAFSANGYPAFVYLSSENAMLAWNGGAFRRLPDPVLSGPVLSIAAVEPGFAELVVQRDDGVWDVRIDAASGQTVSQTALSGINGPVLMLASGQLIYADANGIVIRKPDGSEKHLAVPLPDSFALRQMGDGWVQLRQFAVRIAEEREQVFVLPEGGQ